ncbi:MAG: hypothetical protein K2J08_00485 [Ruminococcus sp.]|nr:hypothetical protein [Ruminococcus sp.]
MNIRKILAVGILSAVSAFSAINYAIQTSAQEITVPYRQSTGAFTASDDRNELKINIIDKWGGNSVEDISAETDMGEYVKVNFTVSGLEGTKSHYAYLMGSIGANSAWIPEVCGNEKVYIKGDGDYTAVWNISENSDSVDNLVLQSDIKSEDNGVVIKINSIVTDGEETTETSTKKSTSKATTKKSSATTYTTTTADTITTVKFTMQKKTTENPEKNNIGISVFIMAVGGVAVIAYKRNQSRNQT